MCETSATTQGHLHMCKYTQWVWRWHRACANANNVFDDVTTQGHMSICKCLKLVTKKRHLYVRAVECKAFDYVQNYATYSVIISKRQVHVQMHATCLMMSQRKDKWACANAWNLCDNARSSLCVQRQERVRMTLDKLKCKDIMCTWKCT